MNRKKWTISEKLLFAAPLLLVAIVSAMIYLPRASRSIEAGFESLGFGSIENARRTSCQSNLKQMGLGVMQYVRDYDEKYPLVATRGRSFGWGDLIQPYLKSTAIFHCPKNSQIASINPAALGYTDYFYNANLAKATVTETNFSSLTVLFGEGVTSDARYAKTQLPPQWVAQPKSPARLHFQPKSATINGANYAFADGHVKWIVPQKIGTTPASQGNYTFSIR